MPFKEKEVCMESQIFQSVEDVLRHHFSAFEEALIETMSELKNLLRIDEYHRHGHEVPQLEEALGAFGSANINLASLSEVLGSSGSPRLLEAERLQRIHQLVAKLEEIKESAFASAFASPSIIDIEEDEAVIREKAEAHFNQVADIFRNLSIAQLEIRSKYQASKHDPLFEHFNWRQLSPAELRLCPPFLVVARLGSESGSRLGKIMTLLESGKPIKVVAMRSTLRKAYAPASDPGVPAAMAVEMLPLAMRGVYFLQSCIAAPDFSKRLFEALTAPRPSFLSLLSPKDGEDEAAFLSRADRAMRSRAFPAVLYDPDLDGAFVSCFDFSSNPEAESDYAFADFAVGEEEFSGDFAEPDAASGELVPISTYLKLNRHQRVGKSPCVYLPGDDEKKHPKLASQAVVTQASDQIHLWKTLQEIAGIDNPHVKKLKVTLEAKFGVEKEALRERLQEDLTKSKSRHEQAATAAAVRNIVSHFTGVDPSKIDLENQMAAILEPGNNGN